jgi:hypothetical protein
MLLSNRLTKLNTSNTSFLYQHDSLDLKKYLLQILYSFSPAHSGSVHTHESFSSLSKLLRDLDNMFNHGPNEASSLSGPSWQLWALIQRVPEVEYQKKLSANGS